MKVAALRWLRTRFELARRGDGANLPAMEGLRGLAVVLVFLVHFVALSDPWVPEGARPALWAVEAIGHTGVDLFFVLSGYLIYGSLIVRPRRFGPYFRRRLQRIYPTFLVVLLVYLVLYLMMPHKARWPAAVDDRLLYVAANLLLLPGMLPIEPIVTVAWSLSYEMFYYLALPLLISSLRLRTWPPAGRVAFFGLLALGLVIYSGLFVGPVRLVMFIAGILLYEALARPRPRPPSAIAPWLLVALLVAAGAITVLRPVGSEGYALRTAAWFFAFFALCHVCFSQGDGIVGRSLSWTPLRWLGNMSYSYYLVHGLTLSMVFAVLSWLWPVHPAGVAELGVLIVLAFAITLVPAAALFLLVERPLSLSPPVRRPMGRVPGPIES